MSPDVEVVIVGAGFSGIGAAIALRGAGVDDVLLVEEADGFGGTWFWNRYPGIAVDIPSFSYQFSFEQRTSWTRSYAHGDELRAYAEDCARKHGLRERTRFGTRVTAAAYDEEDALWRLRTSAGDELRARFVVDATGVLTVPKPPDIPGLADFGGTTVHTARWDEGLDLRGRRVAVIGTGASAVQLVPAIADEVEHLTVFQRTPIWCLPKLDVPLPGPLHAALDRVPGAKRLLRLASQAFVELSFPLTAHYHRPLHLARAFEALARRYVRQEVADPGLRAKLTPRYALGCKRPSFHNEYLGTFSREDVTLETDPIARITPTGIETASATSGSCRGRRP
jgi:cation diffusion facilitator CzcD-associated flavoprotein CzcO